MKVSRNKTLWITTSILFATLLPNLIHPALAAAQSPTTLMVPLYSYPSAAWSNLAQQKAANPSVPIVAVINPSNGPGTWADPNFVSGIQTLKSAGITVIGYTHSSYASRPLAAVESDVLSYVNLYGIGGVYVDEMTNVPGYESYYSALTQYAHSIGMSLVIGNPGADVPSSYIGTVDSIIIYENHGLPSLSSLAGWHTSYSRSNFGFIAYGMTWLDASYIASASSYVGYIYITDGVWPNPFSGTPSYLSTLLGDIAQGAPSSNSGAATGTSTIAVSTVDSIGGPIYGYYTTLWQNGVQLQSCFSACTFTVGAGQTYQVAVASCGGEAFSHWSDSATNQFFSVVAPSSGGPTSLTAVYNP